MRKNLQHLKLKPVSNSKDSVQTEFTVIEGIKIKKNYDLNDIQNLNHIGFGAGVSPNLRGINSMMYVKESWKVFYNTYFSSAKNNNIFCKEILGSAQKELYINLNTSSAEDLDCNKELINKNKQRGVIINSVEDMKTLFYQIPLSNVCVSIPVGDNFLPILAFYIVTAMEQGIDLKLLSGNLTKEISKLFTLSENNNISPILFEKIISDVTEYTKQYMPKFNDICISGYELKEMGATADMELAYTLSYGLEYIKRELNTGLKIDKIAPNLSFSFGIGMNYFIEIAKLRAGRMIWAKLISGFNPTNSNSLAMKIHCQTSTKDFDKQNRYSNINRKCIEASASIFGGTQSLSINSLGDKHPEQININTDIFLREETKIDKTIDPWAGSYLVENLTAEIAQNTWNLINEIEKLGGISNVDISSILKQEKSENKQENKFSTPIKSIKDPLNEGNSFDVIEKKLQQVKDYRDDLLVKQSLDKLRNCVNTANGNILELAIEATKCRATLKEINEAIR